MTILVHLLLFAFAACILWFFAGMLIEATEAVARRFNRNSFTIAFFVLGFLTSIGELSIMANSVVEGVPQISVGNLIGSSLVTLLLIIPILALLGRGVHLKNTLNKKHLALALFVALLPALMVLDGDVKVREGILCLLAYATLFYFIEARSWWQRDSNSVPEIIEEVGEELVDKKRSTKWDVLKIVGGAAIIFFTGNLLVGEAVFLADIMGISASAVGLLVLSVGTNTPELVIAVHAIRSGNVNIAFGDYLGSTVAVTCIFGLLSIGSGQFVLEPSGFFVTTAVMIFGFVAFYVFSASKERISPFEGAALLSFYMFFLVSQFANALYL